MSDTNSVRFTSFGIPAGSFTPVQVKMFKSDCNNIIKMFPDERDIAAAHKLENHLKQREGQMVSSFQQDCPALREPGFKSQPRSQLSVLFGCKARSMIDTASYQAVFAL